MRSPTEPGMCARLERNTPQGNKKARTIRSGLFNEIRQRPTLPHAQCSTIGAGGLNFRVRDGNGWNPSAIATGKRSSHFHASKTCDNRTESDSRVHRAHLMRALKFSLMKTIKPHGLLVLVSSTHYCASTPSLSTS